MLDHSVKGKKLLVLGGTSASVDLVKIAHKMGAYVIVTDEADISERVAKQIADETANISTTEYESLLELIKERKIDGVFCGPSEFNLNNLINLCSMGNLPCYANPSQWSICSNKKLFKDYCLRNDVPTAQEYSIGFFVDENDSEVEYPLIVKPVDGCSSKGISICNSREEVIKAYSYALENSSSKKAIIERYIDNGGKIFSFRYILDNGNYYPYLTFDTYIVDPVDKKYLISAFTYFPSSHEKEFYDDLDSKVQNMFRDMGLKNGVAFVQSIPYKGKIYCHEMGYRLSGGMIYKITEPLIGINDMEMMIRYALGEQIIHSDELEKVMNRNSDMSMAQLMIPLNSGTITKVEGLEETKALKNVVDFLQYYKVGDTVLPEVLGTLGQHFGRYTLRGKNKEEILETVNKIQCLLSIKDNNDKEMFTYKFDTARVV